MEAWKLKHYERVLLYADKILAITNTDALYFTQKYPFVSTYCLPCFFDNISVETVTDVSPENEKYILYHGNLSVLENVRVINYILDNLLPKLDINMRVVIAGKILISIYGRKFPEFRMYLLSQILCRKK